MAASKKAYRVPGVITRKHCPHTQSNTSGAFKPLIQSKWVKVGVPDLYKKKEKYSGVMFWNNPSYEVKTAQLLSQFKNKFPSLASAGSL